MAVHWIKTEPWPVPIAVIGERASYSRFMKAKQGPGKYVFPLAGCGHTELMSRKDGTAIVMMAIGPGSPAERVYTIVHEAVHAARFLYGHVGEGEPGKECEAYLIEHIVRRACEALA